MISKDEEAKEEVKSGSESIVIGCKSCNYSQQYPYQAFGFGADGKWYVHCVECGALIKVPVDQVPQKSKDIAKGYNAIIAPGQIVPVTVMLVRQDSGKVLS